MNMPLCASLDACPPDAPRRLRRAARLGFSVALAALLVTGFVRPAAAQSDSKDAKKTKQDKKPPKSKTDKSSKNTVDVASLRKVLVFPADSKGGLSDQLLDIISEVEQGRLGTTGKYRSIYYVSSLPTVKRAVNEQTLSLADATPPFDSDAKVKRVAQIAGYDLVLVTSVDDYQYDADKQQVSLVMSARLIDYSGDKPVIRSVGESANTAEKAVKDEKDASGKAAPATIQLARDLTERLMNELLKPKAAAEKK